MSMTNDRRILIMAGGTGGHVFPALAVAKYLREHGVLVSWLGTQKGIEADVVPAAEFEIDYISVTGLRGKGLVGWFFAPLNLTRALLQAISILRKRRPCAVLGMGGFASGPGGIASWLLRTPLLIHEQNAIAGLTNRILSKFASVVMQGFPATFSQKNALHTGNPVREDIVALAAQQQKHNSIHDPLHVLVFGGSLGAQALNEVVPQALATIPEQQRPVVKHQAGKRHLDNARQAYASSGVEADVVPFIDDMASVYQWADVVICRSGALTVAELAAAGVASVLVPYPYAVDDHQTANAAYLADAGAAMLVPQTELTVERLKNIFQIFMQRPEALQQMSQEAKRQAQLQACAVVAEKCMQYLAAEKQS